MDILKDEVRQLRADISKLEERINAFEDRDNFSDKDPRYLRWMREKDTLRDNLQTILVSISNMTTKGSEQGEIAQSKMAYAEPATDSTPSVSSAIYFGGSNSNSTSKMSTNTISSHGIDTPVGVSNSYNNRLPNGYSLFGPSSIQQENMASSSTSAVSALGGDELPDWIKGIKKSNGSDTSSNSVNSDLRTSFISKLNVSSSQLSPIEDERKSIETTTKCLSLPEQTDLLLKEKAQLREKLDIAKSQPGYLSSSLLQTAEYLKFKQTKAEIMRNFSNNRIFFISKNNERIPHSHYQTICDRAKAQNVSPEMLLQGINLQFITNVDQKKKETIIKDVFIPLYGIGK